MSDEDERHPAVDEEVLHPLDGTYVEMVRRLIQQQHIRLTHQRSRQERLALPLARGGGEGGVRIEPEVLEHRFHAGLHLPRMRSVERVMQAIEIAQGRLAGVGADVVARLVVSREQAPCVAEAEGDDVERRAFEIFRDLLLEAGDRYAGPADHLAAVGAHSAVEQFHDGALCRRRCGRGGRRAPLSRW